MRGLARVAAVLSMAWLVCIALATAAGHTRHLPPVTLRSSGDTYAVDVVLGISHRVLPHLPTPTEDKIFTPENPQQYGTLRLTASVQAFSGNLFWQPPGDNAPQLVTDDAWWAAWRGDPYAVVWEKSGDRNTIGVFDAAEGVMHTVHESVEYAICSPVMARACLLVASQDNMRTLYALDVPTHTLTTVAAEGLPAYSYVWSPTRPAFVYPQVGAGGSQVRAYDVQAGTDRSLADLPPAGRFHFNWSADGNWLAVDTHDGGVWADEFILDVRGGHPPIDVTALGVDDLQCGAWSPTAPEILCHQVNQFDAHDIITTVYTFDPAAGTLHEQAAFSARGFNGVWSPDGTWLAGLLGDERIAVIPPQGRARVFRAPVEQGRVEWRGR